MSAGIGFINTAIALSTISEKQKREREKEKGLIADYGVLALAKGWTILKGTTVDKKARLINRMEALFVTNIVLLPCISLPF